MSDELLQRARELLALRDKATPIEGAVFNRYEHGGGRLYNENGKRTLIADCFNESDREFFFAAHDMADTIRDLLAAFENVRSANVDCMEWYRAAIARAEAAEARLRELASAEPLFLLHTGKIHSDGEQDDWDSEAASGKRVDAFCQLHPGQTVPLIRRPEMQK